MNLDDGNYLKVCVETKDIIEEEEDTQTIKPMASLDDYEFPKSDQNSLSPIEVQKYFGEGARERFFVRSHWLNKQRLMSCVPSPISRTPRKLPSLLPTDDTNSSTRRSQDRTGSPPLQDFCAMSPAERCRSGLSSYRRSPLPQLGGRLDMSKKRRHYTPLNDVKHRKHAIDQDPVFDGVKNNDDFIFARQLSDDTTATIEAGMISETASVNGDMDDQESCHSFGGQIQNFSTKKCANSIRSETPDLYSVSSTMIRPVTPRSKFIMRCLANKMNPRANILVRKKLSNEVNLQHYGMGDSIASQLAASISELPYVNSMNVADNNLTDIGICPLLSAAMTMRNLTELDMSENIIGPMAADAMSFLLSKRPCTLVKLVLRKADVDDFEGSRFINCLVGNSVLKSLDLSKNKIGHAETLNTVQPHVITAAESLAALLRSEDCSLQELKLSWNMIRLDSGLEFARSLASNKSLTYLDLSFNALGHEGGQALGVSLIDNRSLRTLLLVSNSIDSTACFVICVGIEQNLALRSVSLDENPIGEQGARAVMNVPTVVGSRVKLSAARCNTSLRDPKFWFDQNSPCKKYSLDMSLPYDRSVMLKLLNIVANHPTLVISKAQLQHTKTSKPINLKLVQTMLNDVEEYLDDKQRVILENLYQLRDCADNVELVRNMFDKFDSDGSGELDKSEFAEVLDGIGIEIEEAQLNDVMSLYDMDGGGTIELAEFLSFVKLQYVEAVSRIRDMTVSHAMVQASDMETRYVPPRSGIIEIEVIDSFVKKENFSVLTTDNEGVSSEIAKDMGDVATMCAYAFQNSMLRLKEAVAFYDKMYLNLGDKARALSMLLPHMLISTEARILVSKVTFDDSLLIGRVKQSLGLIMRPIYGLPNGYYCLNLAKENDRQCLSKLIELSTTLNSKRMVASKLGIGKIGDVSQKKNWSCFRNERFNGKPTEIGITSFTPIPTSGKLEFDFSGITLIRPANEQTVLSDVKCSKVLCNLCLRTRDDIDENMAFLTKLREEAHTSNDGCGNVVYTPSQSRAEASGKASYRFYSNLSRRWEDTCDSVANEEVRIDLNPPTPQSKPRKDSVLDLENDAFSAVPARKRHGLGRMLGEGSTKRVLHHSNSKVDKRADEQANTRKRLQLLIASSIASDQSKSVRIIDHCCDIIGDYWILARHLACLVHFFTVGRAKKTPYHGTYRVELVVSLYSRVVDLHNIELVLRELTAEEVGCVYCRIGWLNIYNPMKPEGGYELSMSNYEERLVAKTLVALAVVEPGDNILSPKFRWDRSMDPHPGWTVSQGWLTDDGMAKKGVLSFTYYSGEGKGLRGCESVVAMRKALLNLVSVDEKDIQQDSSGEVSNSNTENSLLPGEQYLINNKDRWMHYFYPSQFTKSEEFTVATEDCVDSPGSESTL